MTLPIAPAGTGPAVAATATLAAVAAAAVLGLRMRRLRRERDHALWQAGHDPLTGIANRRGLAAAVQQLAATGQAMALAMLDLDRFKTVNDCYGYRAGDRVLVEVAHRLQQLPAPVALAARLGGDEFALLIAAARHQAEAAARGAWRTIAQQPVEVGGENPVQVFACIGVACRDRPTATSASRLLHEADLAMHSAKTGGGGVRTHTGGQPVTGHPPRRRWRDLPRGAAET